MSALIAVRWWIPRRSIRAIVGNDPGVSLKDGQLDPLHGAAAKCCAVIIITPAKHVIDLQRPSRKSRLKLRRNRNRGFRVPRADVLADIAAVEPISELRF